MSRRTACRAICGLLLTGLTPLLAQETKLDRDIAFARKLATELRFTSLAQREIERLQTANRDTDDFKKIFQLSIEVSLIGARSHPNREEQRTSFKDAVDRSKEFIERYAGEPVANRARRTLIEACYEYGAFLLEAIEIARNENPEQVEDIESQAAGVYRDGITACETVMETLEGAAAQEGSESQRDYFVTWLFKGMLQREMARAVKRDRVPLSRIARDTFEELIFEAGEESLLGLRGWFEMSKIGEVLGNLEVAFDDYDSTILSIRTALDQSQALGLDRGTLEYLFNLLQEASDRAADTLFEQGKIDATLEFVARFREDLDTYGEPGADVFEVAHPTYGHPVFLTEARARSETGDPEKLAQGLETVQRINDLHPSDIIGVRAKNVLKEILDIQVGLVSGALLFEVAKGDFQGREYERAIRGLKQAYGAMSEAERARLGLETWHMIALSFAFQNRYLEATIAASIGLDRYGNTLDAAPEDTADVLDKAWRNYLRDAKTSDVPALSPLKDKVTTLTGQWGGAGSAAKLLWREAERQLGEGAHEVAAQTFAKVPKDTPYFELAQSRIVVAYQQGGDHAKARAASKTYTDWLATAEATIPSDRPELVDSRKQAIATIGFYDAYMDYLEAIGRVGGAPDPTRFEPTISKFRRFIAEHNQDGAGYIANCWDMIARLQAELGQIDRAEESYRTLRNLGPNSPLVPPLATAIFSAHFSNVKSLETELDALVKKEASAAELKPVLERLAEARRAAIASGIDYLDNSTGPRYDVLYSALTIAGDAKDWKTSERFGRRIVELYGNSEEQKENVEKFVTARLGEALLRQKKFTDAVEILGTAAEANPNNYPVKRFLSLAQGGWYEFNELGGLVEVPGNDQPAEAYKRHWTEYHKYLKFRQVPKYTLEWYEFHCECFMFAARAAKKDSAFEGFRDTLFGMAESIDEFNTLRKLGPEGQRLYDLFVTIPR